MPFPGSLATTTRISVDFYSFGYLDVSVRQVSWVQKVSHLEIYGSQNVSFFPIAFRAVSRPMSSLPRHPSKTFSLKKVIYLRIENSLNSFKKMQFFFTELDWTLS